MNKDFVKFIEDYGGIKLNTYQKIYLKALMSNEDIMINPRRTYKKLNHNSIVAYNKAMKNDFYVVTPKGIEEYRGGELVSIEKYKKNKISKYLLKLNKRQREIIDEILIEPYGTTRYEILRLHLAILDLKINLIKEIFKIK